MPKNLKISLVQCRIHSETNKMSENISRLVKLAAEGDPDIIVLPERWRPLPDFINENVGDYIQVERGRDYRLIKDLSKRHSVPIISGAIWENRRGAGNDDLSNVNGNKDDTGNDKKLNDDCVNNGKMNGIDGNQERRVITSYFFDGNGAEIGRQDKLHLYSFEPRIFRPGNTLNIFRHPIKDFRFCILICFDIAFYETPRLSVENGAELLISPTLINQNGLQNWRIYLQARALENRVPIAACNPIGDFFGRHFPGNSKVISFKPGYETPTRLKTRELEPDYEGILTEEVNLRFPNKIRKKRLREKIDIGNIIIREY